MANDNSWAALEELVRAAIGPDQTPGGGNEAMLRQLGTLAQASQQQADSIRSNTAAVEAAARATRPSASSGSSPTGSSIGDTLLGGLTLSPIVGGLINLFGGGSGRSEPLPLERFVPPSAVRAEAAISPNGSTFLVDRAMGDRVRPVTEGRPEAPPPGVVQNITVEINALDSRSFLDRRDDIARAVREAMLHSHSLNDVVGDL